MRLQTALFLTLALTGPALAQDYSPEDVPDNVPQEEVAKRVARILEAIPTQTVELEGVAKLTYKPIPTDVHAVAVEFGKGLASNYVPRGIDRDVFVRQYEPQISRLLEEHFAHVGTFEALAPLEARNKDIPAGEYGLGIAFRDDRPAAFVLTGDLLPKGKPLALKLKLKRDKEDDTGRLKLALITPEEQDDGEFEFDLEATLRGALARTKKPFEQIISSSPSAVDERSLYRDHAEIYDLVYHWKDYAAEAAQLRELLSAEGIDPGARVLEAACGTGGHLVHLAETYKVAGLDLEEAMLAVAQKKLPGVELVQADMTDFIWPRPVDAILSLFSSIGYVHPKERLQAASECFRDALRDGGVVVIEPWISPETFDAGRPTLQTYESDDVKIARAVVSEQVGRLSRFDFHYLIAQRDLPVEHVVERHELYLHTRDEMTEAFESSGFRVRWDEEGLGRSLLIGTAT